MTIFGCLTCSHTVPAQPRSFNALIRYYKIDFEVLHKEFP
jgi:hypothetical protein